MKKNILLLLMSFLFFRTAHAQDQEWSTNFYAKFLSGVNFLQNTAIDGNKSTYQTGYMIAGSSGYCWCYCTLVSSVGALH